MTSRKTIKWWVDLGFSKKSDLETHIRALVGRYPDNTPINPDDHAFITAVLSHHYQWPAKVGAGIAHIEIRTNVNWSGATRGFWLVRVDGSSIDISWVVALQPGGRPSQKNCVTTAARYEVFEQIHEHHRSGECSDCQICGVLMVRGAGLHVDHEYHFDALLADFMAAEGVAYDDIAINDLGLDSQFSDRDLGARWQQFHRQFARLRLVHSGCNLQRGRA